jgi:hypothetical protein
MASVDFRYENHGSVDLIVPLTEAGRDALMARAPEDAQWWGDGLMVEPHFVGAIIEDLDDDGFVIVDGQRGD